METRFLCMTTAQEIGSRIDGWEVVWCQPDRCRVLWHVMVNRPHVEFRGCCD